jgi:hypothetical protein
VSYFDDNEAHLTGLSYSFATYGDEYDNMDSPSDSPYQEQATGGEGMGYVEDKRELDELKTNVRGIERGLQDVYKLIREKEAKLLPPEPALESVVKFSKVFDGTTGRTYYYSAVRSPRGWSVTGRTTMNGIPWDQLIRFIRSDETYPDHALKTLRVATGFRNLVN